MRVFVLVMVLSGALATAQAPPQRLQPPELKSRLEEQGRVELPSAGLIVERADFRLGDANVEAIVTRPVSEGRKAALLLVPGHSRTAFDMLPQAVRFARAGFATMAVTQPGYGGSSGPADFAGPRTFAALKAAAERLAGEAYVDSRRMGVYGYSRGALAAAQLATRTDLFKAAVLGGGIYDFRAAYDQVRIQGIRANMAAEAGMSDGAVRFRSPIHDVKGLDGPVLIVHGREDENAPPAQASALAERLEREGLEHELILVPGKGHGLAMDDIMIPATRFFVAHLNR